MRVVALAALLGLARGDCPEGCPAKCPDPIELRADFVRHNFTLGKYWGTYYELQYHDNTQPHFMSCQRSVKSLNPDRTSYKDLFSTHFFGNTTAVCDLEYNLTAHPGVLNGHWWSPLRPDLHNVSNVIVDVGAAANGTYEWGLEFQCRDNSTAAAKAGTPSGIQFAAINFYHRNPLVADSVLLEMANRARARGLDWILTVAPGLHKPNHKTCVNHNTYPPKDAKPKLCGQRSAVQVR
eukprot:TRINITY_DN23010_c0_g1_i1.p1 TRINITY_DN23010_c0_g1~~TRINITY_DN23010_c0_g1_i1.p1  ORF type:complete len:237 (+),score=47.01 TRINITY_DN23010_c0_g1_i1:75-785(+)